MPRRKKDEEEIEWPSNPDRLAHAIFAASLAYSLGMDYIGLATAIAFALLPDLDIFFGHRIVLHNIIMAILIPAVITWAAPAIPLRAALLGYMSHLALDILSPTGIAILWPVFNTMISVPFVNIFIKSGVRTLAFSLVLAFLLNYNKILPFLAIGK